MQDWNGKLGLLSGGRFRNLDRGGRGRAVVIKIGEGKVSLVCRLRLNLSARHQGCSLHGIMHRTTASNVHWQLLRMHAEATSYALQDEDVNPPTG